MSRVLKYSIAAWYDHNRDQERIFNAPLGEIGLRRVSYE